LRGLSAGVTDFSGVLVRFTVAAALAMSVACAAVASCSSGSATKLLFNAKLPDGVGTYRAYRLPWNPGS
jgi:hypothetical protein